MLGCTCTTENTAENASKLMNKESGEGHFYGLGSIRAKVAPKFKTTSDIKKAQGKLVSSADFKAKEVGYHNKLDEISRKLDSYKITDGGYYESTEEALGNYIASGNIKDLSYRFKDIPNSLVKEMDEFAAMQTRRTVQQTQEEDRR